VSAWPRWPLAALDPIWDAEAGIFDAERLLWREPDAYRAPQQNAARALAEVNDALLAKRPLGGAEQQFLDAYAELCSNTALREALWSQPRAVFWTHIALDLLCACLEGTEPAASTADWYEAVGEHVPARALARHLAAFESLYVPARLRLVAPAARCGDYALPIDASALAVPGYRHAQPALAAGSSFAAKHRGLVSDTLAALARHAPELFAEFRRAIRVIALKPLDAGGYDDYSNPELPGAFIASVVHNPLEMGDHFLHELQHNRLSFLEEAGPLFDEPSCDPAVASGCYSPWRDQPRSLYGVYHGVYVFAAVYRYWRGVHASADLGAEDRDYAIDRLLRLPRQLTLAVSMLERYARLTPFGRGLMSQLARDVAAIRAGANAAGLPADAPALRAREQGGYERERDADGRALSVREALRAHVQRHAAGGQCVPFLNALA
jgi:hypothetical protein